MRVSKSIVIALVLSFGASLSSGVTQNSVFADTLVLENTGQFYNSNKPQKGMTKNQVRKQYGEPVRSFAAVGNPPITRWKFDAFTVYFEHNHVIHAVDNKRSRSVN